MQHLEKCILQCFIVYKTASCGNAHCLAARLLDPTHRHAHMLCLYHDHGTFDAKLIHQGICDLIRQLFLQLQPSGKYLYRSCQLAQPGNLPVRDICHMCFP